MDRSTIWGCQKELKQIADALGTDETGDDLVAVAKAAHQGEQEAAWVREKWNLPPDASDIDFYGAMNVGQSYAQGYETYITAFKCNDKQGKIARLTVRAEIAEHWVKQMKPVLEAARAMLVSNSYTRLRMLQQTLLAFDANPNEG